MSKIPNKPMRPKNGYFRFRDEVFDDYRKKFSDLKITELTKKIAQDYKALPDEKRSGFEAEFKKDQEVYAQACSSWKEKYGHLEEKKPQRKGKAGKAAASPVKNRASSARTKVKK